MGLQLLNFSRQIDTLIRVGTLHTRSKVIIARDIIVAGANIIAVSPRLNGAPGQSAAHRRAVHPLRVRIRRHIEVILSRGDEVDQQQEVAPQQERHQARDPVECLGQQLQAVRTF